MRGYCCCGGGVLHFLKPARLLCKPCRARSALLAGVAKMLGVRSPGHLSNPGRSRHPCVELNFVVAVAARRSLLC